MRVVIEVENGGQPIDRSIDLCSAFCGDRRGWFVCILVVRLDSESMSFSKSVVAFFLDLVHMFFFRDRRVCENRKYLGGGA